MFPPLSGLLKVGPDGGFRDTGAGHGRGKHLPPPPGQSLEVGPVVPRPMVAGLDASAIDAPQGVAGQMKAPFLDAHATDLMLPRDLGHDRVDRGSAGLVSAIGRAQQREERLDAVRLHRRTLVHVRADRNRKALQEELTGVGVHHPALDQLSREAVDLLWQASEGDEGTVP